MKKQLHVSKIPHFILAAIILFAFAIRIYNLHYNSPFLDEAQYIVLGQKVLTGHWQEANPFSWVGGVPLFYPPLAALFGMFGITGARFLNVLLGTFSVFLIYELTKSLQLSSKSEQNALAGYIASGLMAVLAIPVYLSRLAIYDMLSFTLFLLGLVFFIKGLTIKKPNLWDHENLFGVATVAFAASFLAKYTTLIFIPFITLFGFWYTKQRGSKIFSSYLRYLTAPLSIIVGGYVIWQYANLVHFQTDQLSAPENFADRIIRNFITYSAVILPSALIGAIILAKRRQYLLPLGLITFALIAPAVHVVTNNLNASSQHVFLPLIFLLPLSAYAFMSLIDKRNVLGGIVTVIMIAGTLIYSYPQIRELESAWPNTDAVMSYLRENTTSHERVLSSQDDITVLGLPNLSDENITGIYTFEYKEKTGPDAYRLALTEDYFDFVLLNDHDHQEVERVAREALTSHYKLTYNQSPFVVYQLSKK